MSDKDIEQQIQAKGKTAPRVTPGHIESIIVSEHYFTAGDAVKPGVVAGYKYPGPLDLLTFCVLTLKNGFTVTGESACASPENFDAEIGRSIARDNAIQKVWMLEGYLLKQRLYVNGDNSVDDQFQHFLSYSGYHAESREVIEKLRKAYSDGAS